MAYCNNIPDCAVSILDKLVNDLGGEVVGEKAVVEAAGEHGGSTNATFPNKETGHHSRIPTLMKTKVTDTLDSPLAISRAEMLPETVTGTLVDAT